VAVLTRPPPPSDSFSATTFNHLHQARLPPHFLPALSSHIHVSPRASHTDSVSITQGAGTLDCGHSTLAEPSLRRHLSHSRK